MKNLVELLKKLSYEKKETLEYYKFKAIGYAVAFVHVILLITFLLLNVKTLVLINVLSVLIYIGVIRLVSKRKFWISFLITYIEIMVFSIFANYFVGWDFGFYLYGLSIVPVCFYMAHSIKGFRKRFTLPIILSVICVIVSIVEKLLSYAITPVYFVENQKIVTIIYILNSVVSYSMIIFFSMFFILEMRSNQMELERKNDELNHLANYDALTSLLNRRMADQYLHAAFNSAINNNKMFSVGLGDIDDFKKINDTYGHECGDYVLKFISRIIENNIGEENIACRWGGEEILFILNCNRQLAVERLNLICKEVREAQFLYEGKRIQFTMTFGIEEYETGCTIEKMIHNADDKMYIGKNQGKNCVIS